MSLQSLEGVSGRYGDVKYCAHLMNSFSVVSATCGSAKQCVRLVETLEEVVSIEKWREM